MVKIRAWHGVVLDLFTGRSGKTALLVQTVRNLFRRLNPEYIELDRAPDAITLATIEDLQAEIVRYQGMLDKAIVTAQPAFSPKLKLRAKKAQTGSSRLLAPPRSSRL